MPGIGHNSGTYDSYIDACAPHLKQWRDSATRDIGCWIAMGKILIDAKASWRMINEGLPRAEREHWLVVQQREFIDRLGMHRDECQWFVIIAKAHFGTAKQTAYLDEAMDWGRKHKKPLGGPQALCRCLREFLKGDHQESDQDEIDRDHVAQQMTEVVKLGARRLAAIVLQIAPYAPPDVRSGLPRCMINAISEPEIAVSTAMSIMIGTSDL